MKHGIRVGIVGAGWAGMATAVTLAEAGVAVTMYEAGKVLGGRARRVDTDTGTVDNGLHILLGAYGETLRLIDRFGAGPASYRRLPLTLEIGNRFRLRCPPWPAPLHLLAGLASARGLSWHDRLNAALFMAKMRRARYRTSTPCSVATLLEQASQTAVNREFLWHPLCVAALNTPAAEADAQVFLNVLRDGLDGPAGASDLVLPRVDLSALFPEPAARHVIARGGTIHTGRTALRIDAGAEGLRIVDTDDSAAFDAVVCAVDAPRLEPLVSGLPALRPAIEMVRALRFAPIASVYLQYPPQVRLPFPMLGLTDGPGQWVFDRGALCHQPGLLGAVTSSATDVDRTSPLALAEAIHTQLGSLLGPLPRFGWHRLITEKRATFVCAPGLRRPASRTPVAGLLLAGDYVESDYPATLEAAVRSGLACARSILESH